ncbi:ferredoxin [[Clostridium] cellulosi]|uniref:Ferredoxin n=1 Tax=[Clostridium] cellulosi TaxID=29343 RepID=A0A078KTA4_9FIRM|nr:ferredoxin [[Clostridium] cellulosi]
MKYQITVSNGDFKKTVMAKRGETLLNVLQENNLIGDFPCAGNGTCGKCRVRVISGVAEVTDEDRTHLSRREIEEGYRISCRLKITSPMEVSVSNVPQDYLILTQGKKQKIKIASPVKKCHIVLKKDDFNDGRSDLKRVSDSMGINRITANPAVLRDLNKKIKLSGCDFTVTTYNNTLIDVESGDTTSSKFGIAVDIGTTTVVSFLIDLSSGKIIDKEAETNSQRRYGADVISRIDFTDKNSDGTQILSNLIKNQINGMVDSMCTRSGVKRHNIYEMTVTGNTIMLHFFLGLPTKNIAVAPFTPIITEAVKFRAEEVGIKINGIVSVMPGIASYVGGDITAGILACGMMESNKYSLLIDLGTNGEIALGSSQGVTSCAVAAGPAFEGGNIKCGVGGVKGAIYSVDLDKPDICKTIGDEQACGICGSGVIDAVSELLKHDIIDYTGRFADKEAISNVDLRDRLIEDNYGRQFILAEKSQQGHPIVITQKDIREVQLAKAAVAAGIQVLLKESDVSCEDIEKVYVAGGFGSYMNIESALNIGLIPSELKDKISFVGNTAGMGAVLYLLSKRYREKAETITRRAAYIELSNKPEFQNFYIENMTFE